MITEGKSFLEECEEFIKIFEQDDGEVFNAPGDEEEREEKPEYEKDPSEDTFMGDCDASNCFFYDEAFKGQCKLRNIEVSNEAGCKQFRAKESLESYDESIDQGLKKG